MKRWTILQMLDKSVNEPRLAIGNAAPLPLVFEETADFSSVHIRIRIETAFKS